MWPVGTGPDSVPSPNTAFWRTSWRSTAIEIAWRTRLSVNGLRVEFITWMVTKALGLRITVTLRSSLSRAAPSPVR